MRMTKPMLAAKLEWERMRYPVFVSPKIDGIRCVVQDGKPMSRSWKVLPNRHLQQGIAMCPILEYFDGEVVVGDPSAPNVYNASMSGIMSQGGMPNFKYLVFDYVENPHALYSTRLDKLRLLVSGGKVPSWVHLLPQALCSSREEVEEIEGACLDKGFEGVIARDPNGHYKYGRSTAREGYLLKLKRYEDTEATVVGYEELMHNDNPAFLDVQGHTKHTSHKAGQRPGGVLGALECRMENGLTFFIGSGFDHEQRIDLWNAREALVGRVVKFRHLPHGRLEKPRHPVFLGWRDTIDM
jgi:DNA ligase-1